VAIKITNKIPRPESVKSEMEMVTRRGKPMELLQNITIELEKETGRGR
jgi:hypothetical protein